MFLAYHLPQTIATPNLYQYHQLLSGLAANDVESVELTVDGIGHDAHIGLAQTADHDGNKWEILLGGWDGTVSIIRGCNQCSFLVKKRHTKQQFLQVNKKFLFYEYLSTIRSVPPKVDSTH